MIEESVWHTYKNKVIAPNYLWKKIALMVLCRIHDFTRYKVCRTLLDLFYWPNGFCADTVVIILFFSIGLLSLWDDASIIANCSKCFFSDLIFTLKTGLKFMDEDEW